LLLTFVFVVGTVIGIGATPLSPPIRTMEPLTALSLAANILQFIDFASKLVSSSIEISRSSDGLTVTNSELTTISESLLELNLTFEFSDDLPLSQPSKNLIEGCNEVGRELRKALDRLKNLEGGQKWSSVRQALLTIWRSGEITALAERLDRFRQQLMIEICAALRYGNDVVAVIAPVQ
jgi:hypothetical protein